MNEQNKRFCIYNFGCKVNQEEGGAVAALFSAAGWTRQEQPEQADLLIVNTCTVTQTADKKARNLIRRWRREQPDSVLAVCGCYAQRAADDVAELGADIVAGVDDRAALPQLVAEFLSQRSPQRRVGDIAQAGQFTPIASVSDQLRARAYLKVEDGCDQFCHYCVIPYVRGPIRSLPLPQAVDEARLLLEQGHQELVLTGIHIGAYGTDLADGVGLPQLIRAVLALDSSFRLHLGSVEPQQFTPQLLELIEREPRLCPHLHIPLQAGCDRTLAAMGRRYDTAAYARLLAQIRERRGDVAFTSDVMVGYPGERAEDFAASAEFCQQCGFADLHVFPYSLREGTVAYALPQQVAQAVKAERAARLGEIAAALAESYARRYVGKELDFIAEETVQLPQGRFWRGHSENYLTVLTPDGPRPGRRVRAEQWTEQGLMAVPF